MKKSSKIIIGFFIVMFVLLFVLCKIGTTETSRDNSYKTLLVEDALSYLTDIEEIKWVKIDSNNAYIGFSPRPNDWELIIKGAALNANKVTNFGFHVWAVDASKYNESWTPSTGKAFGEVTARKGKIE